MAAIYMWVEYNLELLTTTLYPIELIDGVNMLPTLVGFGMRVIPEDTVNADFSLVSMSLRQLLKTYGPVEDTINADFALASVTLRQLLKTYGPVEDTINADFILVDMTLDAILVRTQILPHGVDVAPSLISFNMV